MVEAVKACVYVAFHKPVRTRKGVLYLLQCRLTTSVWSESMRPIAECRLINAFQNHLNDFLHEFIVSRLYAEWTLFIAVFLSDIFPARRLWTVTAVSQGLYYPFDSFVTHAIHCGSIGACCHTAVIGIYVFVGEPVELRIVQIPIESTEFVRFIF